MVSDSSHPEDNYTQLFWLLLLVNLLLLAACGGQAEAVNPMGDLGNPEHGEVALTTYGCPSCHTIPGIRGANATVGPPLDRWAARHYIAGALPNTPDNLILWIRFPQSVEPGTAMPDMGVTEQDARDIAAYLYTLD